MAPYLREPPVKADWPPKGYAKKVPVTLAEDWWILAAVHGRSDPWDIIVFNFKTRDPNEVNWYLHHKVGCTTQTADGKNYRFGGPSGSSLHIYIPPASWTPPTSADDDARELVRQVIHSPAASGMHISVPPYQMSISSSDFKRVGGLVNEGRIHVRFDPLHPHAAEYKPGADTMILSELTHGVLNRGTIVHEAVHASFDYRRSQGVYTQVVAEECFAYIVQMRYLQNFYGGTWPGWGPFPARPIWIEAWKIANDIRTGKKVDHDEAMQLKDTLTSTPGPYNGRSHHDNTNHNGVR